MGHNDPQRPRGDEPNLSKNAAGTRKFDRRFRRHLLSLRYFEFAKIDGGQSNRRHRAGRQRIGSDPLAFRHQGIQAVTLSLEID